MKPCSDIEIAVPYVRHGGQQFPIAHLAPVERRVTVPVRGNLNSKVLIEIRFTSHCYSRSVVGDEIVLVEDLIAEGHGGKRCRVFCPIRYELSFLLLGHLDRLLAGQGKVFPSRHHNFFSIELAALGPQPAAAVTCYVFVAVKKKRVPNIETRIVVTVESAYPAQPSVHPPASKNGTAFIKLLGKVWSGAA